ncbi:NYN domain-containing protein [Bacillus atrophaeus]|uniref:NYN domain-containing protein n=1 Tax=Bacillus atrophaeus TaxID=1452 RepID=UPI000B92B287|nr:NYN domain-containing protein [Bacillus atrophaeus]ASS70130.1 NYN domain-containing protein [Bacillus atrophaeus]
MDESKPIRRSKVVKTEPTPEDKSKQVMEMLMGIVSNSTQQTIRTMNIENKLDNVAIFVDYDNVYWSLMNNFNHDPDHELEEKNLFSKLWDRYGQDNVRAFRVYADFQKIRSSLTRLQKKRVQIRHVYSNGKEGDYRKNSSDIELCIDAIENTYKDPSISCYVFVTADSDMIPIMSRLMYKGKRVELFYLSKTAPKYIEMKQYVHYAEDLVELLGVEEKKYDLGKLSIQILVEIKKWHESNADREDRFLGIGWLKKDLVAKLAVPAELVSELLEDLKQQSLIIEEAKELTKGMKKGSSRNQIVCSESGLAKILESEGQPKVVN